LTANSSQQVLANVPIWTALTGIVVFVFEVIGLIGFALDFLGRPARLRFWPGCGVKLGRVMWGLIYNVLNTIVL